VIAIPADAKVWIAVGRTDMRRGFNGLALLVQEKIKMDPSSGHIFVFRGRKGDYIKIYWSDEIGECLFAKRLDDGLFSWPAGDAGVAPMTSAQLAMLLEGLVWRTTRPARLRRAG
jgi:transposase